MASGSPTKKGVSQPPKGAEHQPAAVWARKQARFRRFMAALSPGVMGSAAHRRRRKT